MLSARVTPIRNSLVLAGLLLGLPLSAHAFDPTLCPALLPCAQSGCADPSTPSAYAVIDFHGVRIPDTSTNYPLINAGLHFLHQNQSEQFLLDALTLLCHKPPTTTIDCNDPLLSGQLRGTPANADVFPLWNQVGLPTPNPAVPLTPSAAQVAACNDYVTRSKDVSDLLLTSDVGLQSSPYSTEGMQLRLSLLHALQLRPSVEARCKPTAGAALSLVMQGQCSTLGQYLDDLRFAHLLSDKLSSDNAPARSWALLRVIMRSVDSITAIAAVSNDTPEGRDKIAKLMTGLLTDDWNALRAAIQSSL